MRVLQHLAEVALIALFVPATVRAETTLTFCYDPYPPYTFGTEGAASGGLKVRLLQAVTDRIDGVSANVVLLPWKRCQAQVKAGSIDGILPLFRNAERESYMAFTEGTFQETSRFWYSRSRFPDGLDWQGGLADISHLRLGMLNGSFVDEETEEAFSSKNEILRARDVKSLMRLLLKDRVDLIATDEAVGRFTAAQNGWSEMVDYVDHPVVQRASQFGLSRVTGADQYLAAFNDAIAELSQSGRIDEILRSTDYGDHAAKQTD